jgi:hypothetical protein
LPGAGAVFAKRAPAFLKVYIIIDKIIPVGERGAHISNQPTFISFFEEPKLNRETYIPFWKEPRRNGKTCISNGEEPRLNRKTSISNGEEPRLNRKTYI